MFKGASPRVARGCGVAMIVAACIFGAINKAHAATGRTGLTELSQKKVAALAPTVLAKRLNPSLAATVTRDLVNLAFHESFSSLAKLPLVLRFRPASDAIQGIASTYDPRSTDDPAAGGMEMASGERYDAEGWNAAIRVDLRDKFGGVNFGKYYRPTYALIESNDKRVIVKINDVGSLEPGRVIDLNIRTMRYFDPTLKLGLIYDVKVIPLLGTDMPLGPLKRDPPRNFAGWFT
jgi:peptidoglycan lytic transglycosylase